MWIMWIPVQNSSCIIAIIEAYNADMIHEYKQQCRALLDYWPDIQNADPLLIRDGGHEAMMLCLILFDWLLFCKAPCGSMGFRWTWILGFTQPTFTWFQSCLGQAPFNSTHYNTALGSDRGDKKAYRCAQNWWRHNLTWSACPGVP